MVSLSQIPSHSHSLNDYYFIENSSVIRNSITGTEYAGSGLTGSGGSDNDNNTLLYKRHNTDSVGSGQPHENRPPYYVLAYIMKTKN